MKQNLENKYVYLEVVPYFWITLACGLKFHWYSKTLSPKISDGYEQYQTFPVSAQFATT